MRRPRPRSRGCGPGGCSACASVCVLLGAVLLDGGRRDAGGELAEHGRARQLARLVDALPVGVRQPGRVREPLRDEQAQDDGERGLGRPGALQARRAPRRVPASRPPRRAGSGRSSLPCLLVVVGCSTQSRCAHAAALPCSSSTSEPSSLTASVSSFGCQLGERRAEVEVARPRGRPLLVLALSLLAARLLLGVVRRLTAWPVWRGRRRRASVGCACAAIFWTSRSASHSGSVTYAWLRSFRPGSSSRQPNARAASTSSSVEREALAPALSSASRACQSCSDACAISGSAARRPRPRRRGRRAWRARRRPRPRRVLVGQDRAVPYPPRCRRPGGAALPSSSCPLGAEHVVDDLAGIAWGRRRRRAGAPRARPPSGRRAAARAPRSAPGRARRRAVAGASPISCCVPVGQAQEVEPLRDQPLARPTSRATFALSPCSSARRR